VQSPVNASNETLVPDGPAPWSSVRVLGVRLDVVTEAGALAVMMQWIEAARSRSAGAPWTTRQVVTLNPEMVMAAQANAQLRDIFAGASLVVPDGIGVVWAARLRGAQVPGRVTGVDTVVALARLAAERGWGLFLLGAAPGVAEAAAARLRDRFPGLIVAGTHSGTPDPAEDALSAGLVRASGADVVCVAYGAPAQEEWIARNHDRLGAGLALGVGGTLDVLAGRVPRAPDWMRRAGLEWAFRLLRQPWRWRRMLALPRFAIAVLSEVQHRRS
jgi:N-acetylglucosaminyldiphosphoundecaprenol N-acetyl-beta-D-mannosaminyltransferase